MKITKRQLRQLIQEARWKFDPMAPGGMSRQQDDQYVLERSGLPWSQRFLVQYNMNRPAQEPTWGPLERASRFDSRQMAHHYKQQIERASGIFTTIKDVTQVGG